jgi:NADPH:quinone reductase-like Zn-dependent oxidoreductase
MPFLPPRAALLRAARQPLRIDETALATPGPGEILVRNRAIAINLFDGIVQSLGSLVTPWLRYPAVLGTDLAGEVLAVGPGVSRFAPGDRVLGLALGVEKTVNRPAEGAFQDGVILREACAARMPSGLGFEQAAVLPLAFATAACGLFLSEHLDLRRPSLDRMRESSDDAVLVWGAATSVGSCAIQLAAAAGYRVIATCSARNFDHARRLGAATCVDYHDPAAATRIVEAVGDAPLAGALCVAAGAGGACIDIAGRCAGAKRVAMASVPISLTDAPLTGQLRWKLGRLPRLALGFARLALHARRLGVRTSSIWGTSVVHDAWGARLFENFLEPALASGRFQAAPEPLVAGIGLESIPAAMQRLAQGVSARKVVVSLPDPGVEAGTAMSR